MTIGTLLHTRLTGYSAVSSIVGARVYPLKLLQHPTLEAISYQRIDNGPQKGTSDLRESRWQINCWAQTYAKATVLAGAVKEGFEDHNDTAQTPGIKQSLVVNELDDYDDEVKAFRVIVDVILHTTGD